MMVPGINHRHLQLKRPYHISVADCAIHFCRKQLSGTEVLWEVGRNAEQEVPGSHQGFTNVVVNIPRLSTHEIVWKDDHLQPGRKLILRTEWEKIALMKNLLRKVWKPGRLVLGPFEGHLPTAKACLLEEMYCRFVRSDKGVRC